ncbi:hypothetical protein ATO13_23276 [Stappia sp. 22II-S9-Z10]|nr:hypothetical protein ATO13_23276 [Stappia sp. 22II-S9-Z10]
MAQTAPDDLRAWALHHAANGFRVFRLQPNGKTPFAEGWQNEATNDAERVRRLFSKLDGSPAEFNVGIATGQGLAALDFDCKPKRNVDGSPKLDEHGRQVFGKGLDVLAEWDMLDDLPTGYRQTTTTGGRHVILRLPDGVDVRNSSHKIRPDVDVRGAGGYIVAAGSTVDGKAYTWDGGAPALMPESFIRMCGKPRERVENSTIPLVELDQPRAIADAIRYLADDAPEAVEGAGGDITTYIVACKVRDFGVSEGKCADLMGEFWNEAGKASPPWAHEDLVTKIENAYQHAQNRPGVEAPNVKWPDGEGLDEIGAPVADERDAEPIKAARRGTLLDLSEDRDFTPEPELVRDTIPASGVGFLGGQSGALKTFAAIELAVCLATGEPFAGRKIERTGGVLIAAFEGESTIAGRLKARRTKMEDPTASLPIAALTGFGPIASPSDYQAFGDELVRVAKQFKKTYGVPLVAAVIDTVAAAGMIPEDRENDSAAWQVVFDSLRPISRYLGAPIILVHHYGKTASAGLRGSSNARAGADFVLAMTCDRDEQTGETSDHRLSLVKSRGAAEGPIASVNRDQVVIAVRPDGTPVTSLVLTFNKPMTPPAKVSRAAESIEEALHVALAKHGQDYTLDDGEVVRAVLKSDLRETHRTLNLTRGEKAETVRKWWLRGAGQAVPGASTDGERFWAAKSEFSQADQDLEGD